MRRLKSAKKQSPLAKTLWTLLFWVALLATIASSTWTCLPEAWQSWDPQHGTLEGASHIEKVYNTEQPKARRLFVESLQQIESLVGIHGREGRTPVEAPASAEEAQKAAHDHAFAKRVGKPAFGECGDELIVGLLKEGGRIRRPLSQTPDQQGGEGQGGGLCSARSSARGSFR